MIIKSICTMMTASVILLSCGCCADGAATPVKNGKEEDIVQPSTDCTGEFCHVVNGVIYTPEGTELSLLGVNFQTPLSWEANRLSKVGINKIAEELNAVTDNNIDDVAAMGATLLRCHLTPADFTDEKGNLVETAYLDALDYLIFRAGQKGLYVSFAFLNHMGQSGPGKAWAGKGAETWIHDPEVVACTRNYVSQLVNRVNKYSGVTYGETKNIAWWELINEPDMYTYEEISSTQYFDAYTQWLKDNGKSDSASSYASYRTSLALDYIDSMVELLARNGDGHAVCWGLNWHRYRKTNSDIFDAAAQSKANIVAFCNYPGQDLVSSDYWNNSYDFTDRSFASWFNENFNSVNGYGWALTEQFGAKAKIAYEFETFFNQSAYLYPTQAVYFKSLGAQAGTMWTYTFNEIAEYFGGSHFLNLKCTPSKAASFKIASLILRKEKRLNGIKIADEMNGSVWAISKSHDAAVYSDGEYFCNSGPVTEEWNPLPPNGHEKHIMGCGSSPAASWGGTGVYMIDVEGKEIRIKIMPDVEVVGDRFTSPSYTSKVTELRTGCEHELTVNLIDWNGKDLELYEVTHGGNTYIRDIKGIKDLPLIPGEYLVVQK